MGPYRPGRGRHAFFVKKNYILGLSPYGRATGYIFEIFENRHIFLKFYFFKYKNEKNPLFPAVSAPSSPCKLAAQMNIAMPDEQSKSR